MNKKSTYIAILVLLIVFGREVWNVYKENMTPLEVVMDVHEYNGISSEELFKKMGEHEHPSDQASFYPDVDGPVIQYYYVGDEHLSFLLYNDRVVAFEYSSEGVINQTSSGRLKKTDGYFKYNKRNRSDIPKVFGITELGENAEINNNGYSYDIYNVSNDISYFSATGIDERRRIFNRVRVVFDERFF